MSQNPVKARKPQPRVRTTILSGVVTSMTCDSRVSRAIKAALSTRAFSTERSDDPQTTSCELPRIVNRTSSSVVAVIPSTWANSSSGSASKTRLIALKLGDEGIGAGVVVTYGVFNHSVPESIQSSTKPSTLSSIQILI